MTAVLDNLAAVLEQRKQQSPEKSYVASLHAKGLNKILEKVGEEATETILAAKDAHLQTSNELRREVIKETADLWFHSMVMLSHLSLSHQEVIDELEQRFGLSGLDEKKNRKST